MLGHRESARSTHPAGLGVLMPKPLSSHTSSSGTGSRRDARGRPRSGPRAASSGSPTRHRSWRRRPHPSGHGCRTPMAAARDRGRRRARTPAADGTRSWRSAGSLPGRGGRRPCAVRRRWDQSSAAATPLRTSRDRRRYPAPAGPRGVEATGAVVQQRRVGRPQGERDGRIALVPRRADRVETLAASLQPAGRQVEMAALHLGVEARQQSRGVDCPT